MDRPSFVRTAAAAAVFLALLSGCGGGGRDAARERVDAYVEREQEVMQRSEGDFRRANEVYLAYSRGELEPEAAIRDAAAAERSIRQARDGVAVLDPPVEAQALHDELVRYLQLNVDVARETGRLAAYLPAAQRTLRPLGRINRALESSLAGAEESGRQANALERFAASIGATLADLRSLDPPAVLEPGHGDQVRRLAETRTLARSLRRALGDKDARRVARLLKRFRSGVSERPAPRLAANQARAAYTRSLQRLNDAYAEILREQAELARSLR